MQSGVPGEGDSSAVSGYTKRSFSMEILSVMLREAVTPMQRSPSILSQFPKKLFFTLVTKTSDNGVQVEKY